MLGRRDFTADEMTAGREAAQAAVAAYREHAAAAGSDFEARYFADALLALDRRYVHRVRPVSGKDTNPVTEVELLADSLINHGGRLEVGKVIKYKPELAVLGLAPEAEIRLTVSDFEQLSVAFYAELEKRFTA